MREVAAAGRVHIGWLGWPGLLTWLGWENAWLMIQSHAWYLFFLLLVLLVFTNCTLFFVYTCETLGRGCAVCREQCREVVSNCHEFSIGGG